jgi:hypothetical protein
MIILALLLAVLHPWLVLAVMLSALTVIAAGIACAAGWQPRILARAWWA